MYSNSQVMNPPPNSQALIELQIQAANRILVRKIWIIVLIVIGTFLTCALLDEPAFSISKWAAAYVPSVAKLWKDQTSLGSLPAKFFGVSVMLVPAFAIWLMWAQDPNIRLRAALIQSGKSKTELLLMQYFLGFPFGVFCIFLLYAAPFEVPKRGSSIGQSIFNLMLETHIGLLLFGGIAILATTLISSFLVIYLWLPLFSIYKSITQGANNV